MIIVTPRSRLPAVLAEHRPGRIVALRSPAAEPFHVEGFGSDNHLHLVFNDISEDRPGLVSPSRHQMKTLIAFAREWNRAAPLLVHCYAGVSRSTAAAYIVAAALAPERDEAELARSLRARSPEATPNPYMIRLADALLARDGRMLAAIQNIGRGVEAFEGTPFMLPLKPSG